MEFHLMNFIILGLLLASATVYAQNTIRVMAKLVPDTGSFTAISEKAKGRLLKQGNRFTADRISVFADSFKTENPLRDKHFTEYISGGKGLPHPRIDILNLEASEGKGKATLAVNNVKQPIEIKYKEQDKYVDAEFEVKASDFKLPKANYLGIGVQDEVKIKVQYYFETK